MVLLRALKLTRKFNPFTKFMFERNLKYIYTSQSKRAEPRTIQQTSTGVIF